MEESSDKYVAQGNETVGNLTRIILHMSHISLFAQDSSHNTQAHTQRQEAASVAPY